MCEKSMLLIRAHKNNDVKEKKKPKNDPCQMRL